MNLSKIRFKLAALNLDTSPLFLKKWFFEVFMSSKFLIAKVLHSHLITGSGMVCSPCTAAVYPTQKPSSVIKDGWKIPHLDR